MSPHNLELLTLGSIALIAILAYAYERFHAETRLQHVEHELAALLLDSGQHPITPNTEIARRRDALAEERAQVTG